MFNRSDMDELLVSFILFLITSIICVCIGLGVIPYLLTVNYPDLLIPYALIIILAGFNFYKYSRFNKAKVEPDVKEIIVQPEFKFKAEQWQRKEKWKMIVAKHPDGRILLMANEFKLKSIIKQNNIWIPATMTGEELNEFTYIDDKKEQLIILKDALLNYIDKDELDIKIEIVL